jgi:ribosomal protein S12 methylthiotransferase
MEGCDMFCSFCIVPLTRGREISRPAASIVAEAEQLVARGVREITLLGQTVNAWARYELRRGAAQPDGAAGNGGGAAAPRGFAGLLRRLGAIPGLARLRYTSPHPSFFDAELLRAHAELERLQPHVHLPLQSGSDAVLARMRRRYSADTYRSIAAGLRAARADLALTTDLIVGFPGETDADFEALLQWLEEAQLDRVGCFVYSPVEGAAANALPNHVPTEIAAERHQRFMELAARISAERLARKVGTRMRVLVDEVKDGQAVARSPGDAPEIDGVVRVENPGKCNTGDFLDVVISGSNQYDLAARC